MKKERLVPEDAHISFSFMNGRPQFLSVIKKKKKERMKKLSGEQMKEKTSSPGLFHHLSFKKRLWKKKMN